MDYLRQGALTRIRTPSISFKFGANFIPYLEENVAKNAFEAYLKSKNYFIWRYDGIMTSKVTIIDPFDRKSFFEISLVCQ